MGKERRCDPSETVESFHFGLCLWCQTSGPCCSFGLLIQLYLSDSEHLTVEMAIQGTRDEELRDLLSTMETHYPLSAQNTKANTETMSQKAILQDPKYIIDSSNRSLKDVKLNGCSG